jgi:NTE family protein
MARIGLVLGAGGMVGHAYHAGVLSALADETEFDARDAELIVGTSAGSVVGSLLRAGLAPADLAAHSIGAELSPEGAAFVAAAERHAPRAPLPPRRARMGWPAMAAPGVLLRFGMQPWQARPGVLAAAAMPAGTIPTEHVAAGLRAVLAPGWPAGLWITAVRLDTGRRAVFGRDDTSTDDVATAVAASCAIPGFFAPVSINGVRFVDGGAHSPTNADLLAGMDLDLVIVSSPMSVVGRPLRADLAARRLSRFYLAREAAAIRRRGTPVLTFQPTATDLGVMGFNALDATRVPRVVGQARESALQRLARSDVRDRVELFTARQPA